MSFSVNPMFRRYDNLDLEIKTLTRSIALEYVTGIPFEENFTPHLLKNMPPELTVQ